MEKKGSRTLTKFNKKENKKLKFLQHKRINTLVPITNYPAGLVNNSNKKEENETQ
jgi:hypothetical protein